MRYIERVKGAKDSVIIMTYTLEGNLCFRAMHYYHMK